MGAVRRQSARISDNVKITKTPLKVQDKKGSTSRRGRSALADKTNQQEPEKVKEQLLDERTSKRRSKRTFEGEVDQQREEKKEKKTEEDEEEDSTEEKATNDILEGEVKEEVKVEVIEEPKTLKLEDKKWDPLAGLSDYEKIRLENIRQVLCISLPNLLALKLKPFVITYCPKLHRQALFVFVMNHCCCLCFCLTLI